jgi:hypothetical protein
MAAVDEELVARQRALHRRSPRCLRSGMTVRSKCSSSTT